MGGSRWGPCRTRHHHSSDRLTGPATATRSRAVRRRTTMSSMPEVPPLGHDSDADEVILGVDTHKDSHVGAVITTLGVLVASEAFPATAVGYRQLLTWARSLGPLRRAGVEGSGSYGAALAVLSGRASATAKASDGPVEMIRMFKLAKASALKSRTQAINQLKAVLVCADPALRKSLAGLGPCTLVRRCADLDPATPNDVVSAAVYTLRRLAQRILHLTEEIRDLEKRITAAVNTHNPQLLERHGIGQDSAAAMLIAAGDNPDRLNSEGSFAALCGVSPVDASSGKTKRRRLNRGGDRQANAALYRIVLTRLRWDADTRAYVQRRLAEGKTQREAIRCLKRYVAREVYQIITASTGLPSPA